MGDLVDDVRERILHTEDVIIRKEFHRVGLADLRSEGVKQRVVFCVAPIDPKWNQGELNYLLDKLVDLERDPELESKLICFEDSSGRLGLGNVSYSEKIGEERSQKKIVTNDERFMKDLYVKCGSQFTDGVYAVDEGDYIYRNVAVHLFPSKEVIDDLRVESCERFLEPQIILTEREVRKYNPGRLRSAWRALRG